MTTAARPRWRAHPLEFSLSLVADVCPGEAGTALLLTANVLLLLTAYYLLKVAREPLILLGGGAEVKSYASVGQSILLIGVSAAYGWLASRVGRMALIAWVTLFFVACLVVFWALGERGVPLGIPFFLWVGIFNVTMVAQFWSFAADLYTDEQGKRLFPIIAIGSSVGAVVGAWVADGLLFLGPFGLMLVSAGMLLGCLGLTYLTNRRELARADHEASASAGDRERAEVAQRLDGPSGFALVLQDRYLLLFAGLIFVLNWVTKTGDYVLDRKLLAVAHETAHTAAEARAYVGHFKSHYFGWTNGLGVALQLLAVSRIIKYWGLRWALILMPCASLAGYSASLVSPLIGVLFVARVAESSLDYSLSNTTRQALWLPTSRDAKYKAKQVIDTFVVRAGDVMSAALVWLGARTALAPEGFIACNVVLSLAWLGLAVLLGRSYAGVSERHGLAAQPA